MLLHFTTPRGISTSILWHCSLKKVQKGPKPREGLKTTGWEPESCRKEEVSQSAGTIHMSSLEYQKPVPHCTILLRSHTGKEPRGFALEPFTWQGRWTSWHLSSVTPSLTHGRAGTLSVDVTCQGLLTTQVVVEAAHSLGDHSWKCACPVILNRTRNQRTQIASASVASFMHCVCRCNTFSFYFLCWQNSEWPEHQGWSWSRRGDDKGNPATALGRNERPHLFS